MFAEQTPLPQPVDPFDYAWYVPVLGIIALTMAGLWCVWLLLPSRPEAATKPSHVTATPSTPDETLRALERIRSQFDDGELDARHAHARATAITRGYLGAHGHIDLSHATLQLVRDRRPDLVRLFELAYPGQFAPVSSDPHAAIDEACEVVQRCS